MPGRAWVGRASRSTSRASGSRPWRWSRWFGRRSRANAASDAHPSSADLTAASGRIGRRTGDFSLILEGRLLSAPSQRALLLVGLRHIERIRPGTLDKLASEKARTKRVVARRRESLYGRPQLLKHAEQIEGVWWVATNNSFGEVQKFIRRAAFHAGLHVDIRRSP